MFVVGVVWNTEIRCVSVARSCLMLLQAVGLLTVALYKFQRKKLLAFGIMRFHTSVKLSLACYPEVCVVHWQLKLIAADGAVPRFEALTTQLCTTSGVI